MPVYKPSELAEVRESFDLGFNQGFNQGVKPEYAALEKLCYFAKNVTGDKVYTPILGSAPEPRKRLGSLSWGGFNPLKVETDVYPYDIGVEISDIDLDDPTGAMYRDRIVGMGARMRNFLGETIAKMIDSGAAATYGYDPFGSYCYFADTHAWHDSGTNDNKLSGTGVTQSAIITDLNSAIGAMARFKDDRGQPLGNIGGGGLVIVCEYKNWRTFLSVVDPSFASTGTPSSASLFFGMGIEVIPCDQLTNSNEWYLFNTKGLNKPFIVAERDIVETEVAREINNKSYKYTASRRFGVRYGDSRCAIQMVNS